MDYKQSGSVYRLPRLFFAERPNPIKGEKNAEDEDEELRQEAIQGDLERQSESQKSIHKPHDDEQTKINEA